MRILVVADEQLAEMVARPLRAHGHAVDVATEGGQAERRTGATHYDVIVADRDVPRLHVPDLVRLVVAGSRDTKVVLLSADAGVPARVAGLNLGADDYLVKPVSLPELVARIGALERRSMPAVPPVLEHEGLVLDPARRTATRDGRPLPLTRKEFALLKTLMQAHGTVLSADELLRRVWGGSVRPDGNVLRVTIMTLRRKLGPPSPIVTVVGSGYRLA